MIFYKNSVPISLQNLHTSYYFYTIESATHSDYEQQFITMDQGGFGNRACLSEQFRTIQNIKKANPRSSADRALASEARGAGSIPAGGTIHTHDTPRIRSSISLFDGLDSAFLVLNKIDGTFQDLPLSNLSHLHFEK